METEQIRDNVPLETIIIGFCNKSLFSIMCCIWRMFCCECNCFEAPDDWNIESECREGERGAGWLYKRGKGAAVWGKRYFVLTNSRLIYYTERDRALARGEIVITGATAKISTTRANEKKKYYFVISHPECGTRELYAKSSSRRQQWIDKINELSSLLSHIGTYGKLFKQGGLNKNVWQQRWCHCEGRFLDYFDNATDNQIKGSIDLLNAKIREFSTKDQKYCFEVMGALPGKKGMKKYVFAAETEGDRIRWMEVINASTKPRAAFPTSSGEVLSPIQNQNDEAAVEGGSSQNLSGNSLSARTKSQVRYPLGKMGYLMKKSPALLKGWQKRFFVLKEPGEVLYYGSVSFLFHFLY